MNHLQELTNDERLLFATRIVRLFAYGFLSVVLVLYLVQVGLREAEIGLLLTLTLIGDTLISLWITTRADHLGRRRMLVVGAGLMLFAGLLFALTGNFLLLVLAATIGVISPSGGEVGPFLAIEQAALAQTVSGHQRTGIFAWYNLVGSFATASGALAGGGIVQLLERATVTPITSYRAVVIGYAFLGLLLGGMFLQLSPAVEALPAPVGTPSNKGWFGLQYSQAIVFKLSALFALDSFGGTFVVQSIMAYWFYLRFGVEPAVLGTIFFTANLLAGISALSAAAVARKIGLINTMVFTHIPSNILLMLVPLMPNLPLAITMLLLRFCISQMDVPTRQSYVMAVVDPEERSAAAGVTGIARTLGAALAPSLTGLLIGAPGWINAPFFIAGTLKIIYDLILYRMFNRVKPPEEKLT